MFYMINRKQTDKKVHIFPEKVSILPKLNIYFKNYYNVNCDSFYFLGGLFICYIRCLNI